MGREITYVKVKKLDNLSIVKTQAIQDHFDFVPKGDGTTYIYSGDSTLVCRESGDTINILSGEIQGQSSERVTLDLIEAAGGGTGVMEMIVFWDGGKEIQHISTIDGVVRTEDIIL